MSTRNDVHLDANILPETSTQSTQPPSTTQTTPIALSTITPNATLSERQQNINVQYTLPLPSDVTRGIALSTHTIPTELRISACYEDALKLAAEQPSKVSTKMARLSTQIDHFYTIDNHMDLKPAPYPEDSIKTFDGDKLVDFTCRLYDSTKRPKLGTLKIDFNDKYYGFTVDPKSEAFFTPHRSYNNIEVNTVSIPYQGTFKLIDTTNTVLEILEFINYVIAGSISSYGSNYLFSRQDAVSHREDETFKDSDAMLGFTKLTGGNTLNQFFSPFEVDTGTDFYAGRMSNLMTVNTALSRMDGSIPNDDYIRYPLNLNLLSFKMSSEEIRVAIQRAFPDPRPYGSLKTGVITDPSGAVKLRERCAVNSDVVTYELHRNFDRYLMTLRSDPDLLCELLNDTFLTRAMFEEQIREFQFSHATPVYMGTHVGRTDITIFPHNAMYVNSFKVAERAPGFVTHTFSKVLNMCCKALENFPFMSFEKATASLTTSYATMSYPGLGTALSASSLLINSTSPRVLALLATLNIMPKYTKFRAVPIRYDSTKNPAVFGLTFLGLILKKYMFSNLWNWNKVAWAADCHQFYSAYFPDEYGPIFNAHGYGRYVRVGGGIEIVNEITGYDKLTCPITSYTCNRPPNELGLRNNQLLAAVMNALSLTQWNGIPKQLPITNARYRIRNRIIQIPGAMYSVKTARAPRVLPLGLLLIGYIRGIITDYFNSCKRDAMVKSSISAYDQLIKSFIKLAESYSFYFHIIYNPIVAKAARIPDLFYNDVCPIDEEYNEVTCYFDAARDRNPRFEYNVPHDTGVPIVIPGLSDELLGHNLTGQCVNLLFCAHNPLAVMQGTNTVSPSDLPLYNTFAFLYENTDSVYIISDYVDQLLLRQKFCECLSLVGELSINTLIVNQPALTQIIQNTADLLSGVTAAVFALLANIVNNDNQNINSFNALQRNIFGDVLEDPRVYNLTLGNLTPNDTRGRTHVLPWLDPVRQHVRDNINLVVDRVLGSRLGLKSISQGVTYSMVPFRGPITWGSRHDFPMNYVTIGKSKKRSVSVHENKYEYYVTSVSFRGNPSVTRMSADPDDLYKYITDNDLTVTYPAYTIVLDNPSLITDVMITFITEALNKRHCIVIAQQTATIPTYDECSSGEANESSVLTIDNVTEALCLSNLKVRKPKTFSTEFETHNVVSQTIVRPMLPYNASQPLIVYKNLHTTAVGYQMINADFYPLVVESDDTAPPRAIDRGRIVEMLDRYPCSLTTVRTVYVAPPLGTLSVYIEPI